MVTKLEEERSSKAMKQEMPQVEHSSLSTDVPMINFGDQTELKAMVDAIAAASQREAEAHETAIVLSKENDELRMKLKVLLDDNNKLIELYERATAECNKRSIDEPKSAQGRSEAHNNCGVELNKDSEVEVNKVENLEHQLMEMHEENEKLLGLYERAMQERDDLKRMLSSGGEKSVAMRREFDCDEKVVEVDGEGNTSESPVSLEASYLIGETSHPGLHAQSGGQDHKLENPTLCEEVKDSIEETGFSEAEVKEGLGLADDDIDMCTEETDDSRLNLQDRAVLPPVGLQQESGNLNGEGTSSAMETEPLNSVTAMVSEELDLVRMKLERADQQLVDSAKAVTLFSSLEKLISEIGKLSRETETMEGAIQSKRQLFESLKLHSSEIEERMAVIQKKLSALKYSLSSLSSSVAYFEQREARAVSRVNASTLYLEQKRKELAHLQSKKDEIQASLSKTKQSEVELSNCLARLKLKLEEEMRKQENEKVLFAIDNIEKVDPAQKNWQLGGKATELLKSEEEKTKLQAELKLSQERLGVLRKEVENLNRKSVKVDSAIQAVEAEIQKGSWLVEDTDLALQGVLQEKKTLLEMRDNGRAEIESMIVEYLQHMFEADLKEAEMKELEEELQVQLRRIEELREAKAVAAEKTTQLVETGSHSCFRSEKIEQELQCARTSVVEARLLLESKNN